MTKRTSAAPNEAPNVKRRAPFTAPENVATKAVIARNASRSSLLQLPWEIRNQIWKSVLGDQLIHLEYTGHHLRYTNYTNPEKRSHSQRQCFRHIVCEHDCPEDQLEESNCTIGVPGDEKIVWRQPHYSCDQRLWYNPYDDPQGWKHQSMHLTLLRVCRQIYNEANHVLWTTNTYSFNDAGYSLCRFIEDRTTHQKRLLRRLRFQMDWVWGEDRNWTRWLKTPLIRSLTGLRSLRLQINHSMEDAFTHTGEPWVAEFGLFNRSQVKLIHKMATLPLTDVEVYTGERSQLQTPATFWRAENQKACAEWIRKILVDPTGAETLAQKLEEWDKSNPQMEEEA